MRLLLLLAGFLMWSLAAAETTTIPPSPPSDSLPQDSQDSDVALQPADIRLLIDVSGSMRRTDPNNLRRPALSLLVRLMPAGSAAGVWTFGQDVKPLVPLGSTDAQWKERALGLLPGIDSRALYTNIGAALERASQDREERETHESTRPVDIILLTDGMVDVSPDQQVNAREQARILENLVPELSAAGYRVHTIALSDEADESLLQAVARASDGIFSRARNADDLMDSLLRIFQQMVPGQRLPINEGRFLVDDSIKEFTVLVRREADQAPARLHTPSGETYEHTDTQSQPNLSWYHTERYDLITVTDPDSGLWELEAELQPHSRLTVISDLQLLVQPLPNNLIVGQPLELAFVLSDRHGPIDDPELLSVLTLEAQFTGPEGGGPDDQVQNLRRWRGEPPADGRYRMTLPAPREPGEYRLELNLDGKTFERFFSHHMAVSSVFDVQIVKHKEDDRVHWDLRVEATVPADQQANVDPEASSVVAHVRNSKGYTRVHTLSEASPGVWQLRVTPEQSANYRIGVQASGQLVGGVAFDEELPTQYFSYPEEGDLPVLPLDTAIEELKAGLEDQRELAQQARRGADSVPVSDLRLSPAMPEEVSPEPTASEGALQDGINVTEKTNDSLHPVLLYASLALANGLLLALAYFSYRLITGANRRPPEPPDSDLPQEPSAPPPMQQIVSETDPDEGLGGDQKEAVNKTPEAIKAERGGEALFQDELDDEPLFPLDDEKDGR